MPIILPEEEYEQQQRQLSDARGDAEIAALQYKALLRAVSEIAPDKYAEIVASLDGYIEDIRVAEQQSESGTKGMSR